MKRDIVIENTELLKYEIRQIVAIVKEIEKLGVEISWENIGDPVKKGEKIPQWIKDIIIKLSSQDLSYAYSHSRGEEKTREFIANFANKRGKVKITKEDILFFNGLGDAIGKLYLIMKPNERVIGPSPAYPTHSSFEAFHAGKEPITYNLDPDNNWQPDIDDLREKIKTHPEIAGILIINPNNPTGSVCTKKTMQEIVRIAKENNLFIICDEIYCRIVYNKKKHVYLSEVIGDLPGLSMQGISKEYPWPGSRCGWVEIYNSSKHPLFRKYADTLFNYKLLEVCSTTLPQESIPFVMGDKRYEPHLNKRNLEFEKRAKIAFEAFNGIKGLTVNRPDGAFYMAVTFKKGLLNNKQTLQIKNPAVEEYIKKLVSKDIPLDRRFVYYLIGATGICIVPLTGFSCQTEGFRMVLLETDTEKFRKITTTIKEKILEYIDSA